MTTKINFLRARTYESVTAADEDLTRVADAIYCGGEGTIIITDDNDNVTTVTMVAGGTWAGIVKRVAAGSTATDIVAMYE